MINSHSKQTTYFIGIIIAVLSLSSINSGCTLSTPPDCQQNKEKCYPQDKYLKICSLYTGNWTGQLDCGETSCEADKNICNEMPTCTDDETKCATVDDDKGLFVSFACKKGVYIPRVCVGECNEDATECHTEYEGGCDKDISACIQTDDGLSMQITCSEKGLWLMHYCNAGCNASGTECEKEKTDVCKEGESCNTLYAASATCKEGKCVPDQCLEGYGDCNKLPEDGCETNFSNQHKKSCNECMSGYCLVNGMCLNAQTTNEGCGDTCLDCNHSTIAHVSTASCFEGKCRPETCEEGYDTNGKICCKKDDNGEVKYDKGDLCSYDCNSVSDWNGVKCCRKSPGMIFTKDSETCDFSCGNGYEKSADGAMCIKTGCTDGDKECIDNQEGKGEFRECQNGKFEKLLNTCTGSCKPKPDNSCGECITGTQKCDEDSETHIGTVSNCVDGEWQVVVDANKCKNSCDKDKKNCGVCINGKTKCTSVPSGTDTATTCEYGIWNAPTYCTMPKSSSGLEISCSYKECAPACKSDSSCGLFKCTDPSKCPHLMDSDMTKEHFVCLPNSYERTVTDDMKQTIDKGCGKQCLDCTKKPVPPNSKGVCSDRGACTFECFKGYHKVDGACQPD